jgi:S-adenosylmethionine:tRNA ribosyltransferase-isomerase
MSTRMMLVDTRHDRLAEREVDSLPGLLSPRDLLVVNDAATLPASLSGVDRHGAPLEVRLLEGPYCASTRAVLFGRGDYHTPTELRPPPPALSAGDTIWLGAATLTVESVSPLSPRLVTLRWTGTRDERFLLLYRAGRPVQYSYIDAPLSLHDVQTSFASRPWAVEMPSAARPLRGSLLLALRRRGVQVARLTHAAGLSATGEPVLDAALPLPERYHIPAETVRAIDRTRERGGRVVAVGTSVVRALEDSVRRTGRVTAGEQVAELVLDADTQPIVCAGLLTGIHVPGESHFRLLAAFTRAATLERAAALALARHYRMHELGEAALFLPDVLAPLVRAA